MYGSDGDLGFSMGLGMWIFWILLIIVIVVLVKGVGSGSKTSTHDKSPKEILRERYARGEIDDEEFERRKLELEE